MTERCSLWSALSAAACCFYRGSFMQVQVSGGGGGGHGAGPAPGAQTPPGSGSVSRHAWGEASGGTAGGGSAGGTVRPPIPHPP